MSVAQAEYISVYGIDFPVDEYLPLDRDAVRVSLFGETKVYTVSGARKWIAQTHFHNPAAEKSFSSHSLQGFTDQAIDAGEHRLAATAFRLLLLHPEAKDSSLLSFLEEVRGKIGAISFFQTCLKTFSQETFPHMEPLLWMVLEIAFAKPQWVKSNVSGLLYTKKEEISAFLREQFERAVELKDVVRTEGIVRAARSFYGSSDPLYQQLRLLHTRHESILKAIESRQKENLFPLLELLKRDKVMGDLFSPILFQAVHEQVDAFLQKNQPDEALSLLSRLDLSRRTPTTHLLFKKSLQALTPLDDAFLTKREIRGAVELVAQNDVNVRSAYLAFLNERFFLFLRSGNFSSAEKSFARILTVRPDPNEVNDGLRVRLSLALLQAGHTARGTSVMNEVQTGVSVYSRLRYLVFRAFPDFFSLFMTLAGGLVVGFCVYLYLALKNTQSAEEVAWGASHEMGQQGQSGFSFPKTPERNTPEKREYLELLRLFDLDSSKPVTKKELKTAFRNKIRGVHPDLHQDDNEERDAKFIHYKESYERLVELHGKFSTL